MRIAVITPCHKEPVEKLRRCHDSVRRQTMAADHVIVSDGVARPELTGWDATHLTLPVNCNDSGDTPRLVAMIMVAALGYDAMALLDADNWYEPDHLETLLRHHRASGAPIVTCARTLRRLDGSVLGICREVDGATFCDFNCYLFLRPAFPHLQVLAFKETDAAYFTDRYLWASLRDAGVPRVHSARPTVHYETTVLAHYVEAGETPPPEARQAVYFQDERRWRKLRLDEYQALLASSAMTVTPLTGNRHVGVDGEIVE